MGQKIVQWDARPDTETFATDEEIGGGEEPGLFRLMDLVL